MKFTDLKNKSVNTIKNAADKAKNAVRSVYLSVEAYAVNNPEVTKAVILMAVPAAIKVGSEMHKNSIAKAEMKAKELRMWDPSLRMYLHLRRPVRSREAVLLNERIMNGEKRVDILRDMNLLDD